MEKYEVRLWQGSGYILDQFFVEADSEEEALERAVVLAEKAGMNRLFLDEWVENATDDEIEEAENDGSLVYVDATMEGANYPHYIYGENLAIIEL